MELASANYAQCRLIAARDARGRPRRVRGAAPARILKTGQTTSYGAGSDGALQKGIAQGYVDNGDGMVTDTSTGLMWEKKSDDGSIHDWNNRYTWSGASCGTTNVLDGTAATTFLAALNGGGGFAGPTDWRLRLRPCGPRRLVSRFLMREPVSHVQVTTQSGVRRPHSSA